MVKIQQLSNSAVRRFWSCAKLGHRFHAMKLAKISQKLWSLFRFFLLLGMGYVLLYPLLYMLSTAFRPINEVLDPSVAWIPKRFTMENILDVIKAMKYPLAVWHTVQIGMVSALLQVVSCSLVGYGFARFKFRERELLFMMVLFTILVPPQTVIIPSYLQFRYFDFFGALKLWGGITGTKASVNLLNTGWTFYLPSFLGMGIRSGLYIYVFRQFFRGMPKELEDAALIDGCGPFRTFLKVMAPNASSSFLTVFLFSVVWQWNDYFFSAMYINQKSPISVALATLRSSMKSMGIDTTDPFLILTRLQAGSLLAILPLLIMYIFAQKHFTESIERTGIVG